MSQSIVTLKMALPFIHFVNTKKKGKISPSNYNNFHFENKPLICVQLFIQFNSIFIVNNHNSATFYCYDAYKT